MWLPFRRQKAQANQDESAEARQVKRALRENAASEVLEAEYQQADLDNAGLRFSAQGRSRNPLFGMFGQGRRRPVKETLREQGYTGD